MILLKNIKQMKGKCGKILLATCIMATFACNKTVVDDLPTSYPADGNGVQSQNRKVLYLILDGAEGKQIDTLAPQNISALLKTSVYSWIGMSGANNKDTVLPGAWASMMTGYNSDLTKVQTGFDTANLKDYPSLMTRLRDVAPDIRTVGYSSSKLFDQYLLTDASAKLLTEGDDAAVAANVISSLEKDSAGLIVGQFHSIAEAGDQYGYRYNIPEYAKAVSTVDGYIGEIVQALKARPNYANENWLLVIASNENGVIDKNNNGDSTSAYNDTRRNSFVIFNNPRFVTENIGRDGTPSTKGLSAYNDSTVLLTGTGSSGVSIKVPDDKRVYDLKNGDSATIEFKFKYLKSGVTGTEYFMNIVGMATGFYSNGNAWSFWRSGNGFIFYISDNTGKYYNIGYSSQVNDNNWHTLAASIAWPKGTNKAHINLYLDGLIEVSDKTVELNADLTSGKPLVIGHMPQGTSVGNYTDFYVSDFRYWKTLLPYSIITQYDCKNEIPTSSPYYPYLAADYRINDGNGSTVIKDNSVNHQDGEVVDPSGIAQWYTFNEVSNNVCPAPDQNFYKATPNGLDIPMQIYQWLGVIINPSWNLEGQYWSNGYSDVQVPDNY